MCPVCGVRNPYQSSQDGSREAWLFEHLNDHAQEA